MNETGRSAMTRDCREVSLCAGKPRLPWRSFVLATLGLLASCGSPAPSGEGLVIRDVTVISPERVAPLAHAYVRILDGRIAKVSAEPLRGREEIDGAGRHLIPGLIDSHVHLDQVAGMTAEHEAAHPVIAAAARAQAPRSYLYFGFTTVVDLFGRRDFIVEWNAQDVRPDAYFCGGAPIANGYPMAWLPEDVRFDDHDDFPYFLYDERQADRIPAAIDPAAHTPEAVVARMAEDGAICVKTHYETGFGGLSGLPTPTVEMVQALVAAAHARKMPVFLHANGKEAQAFALPAGVDVIAHGMWNGHELEGGAMADDVEAILDKIVEDNVGYQPTAQVLHGLRDLFDDDFLSEPRLADAAPAALITWYGTDEGRWFRDEVAGDRGSRDGMAVYEMLLDSLGVVIARLAAADARLLFGSDTPSAPTYANPPGLNGRMEMDDWIAAGVSEEKLFRALTIDNARALGLNGEIGTVEVGKVANLLLLGRNPLESVTAYDEIDMVFIRGRPITRDDVSARRVPPS